MNSRDPYIYVLRSQTDVDTATREGFLSHPSLETEGFLHASPWNQLTRVANKYYSHITDLVVLVVEAAKVHPAIKWEPAAGSLYPHIYGPLNMDAVVEVRSVVANSEGRFVIDREGASSRGFLPRVNRGPC